MTFRIKPPVIRRINKGKSHEAQEVLRRLRSFLDENSPKPVKILCNLWNDQQAAITYGELRSAILSGDLSEEMVEAWRQDYSRMVAAQFDKVWKDALAQGYTGQPSMDNLKNFRLDMTTPGVYNWIRQRGADFVTYSTREQKDAIKTLLTRSVTGKHSVDELARAIRPTIGLTQGQAQANVNYYEHMVKTMTEQHPLTSRNVILGRAREAQMRYAEKQHRQRAFTIAKTEQAFAFNKGADEGVRQAMARGFLPPMEKVWSTSWGGNVCPDCEALEGEVVGMDDAFFESRGLFRGDDLLPPLHPRCECAVQYREVEKPNAAGGLRDVNAYNEHELPEDGFRYADNNKQFIFEEANNQREAVEFLRGKLGFVDAKFTGMSVKSINEVNRSITELYNKYPQMKGFIQKIKTDKNLKGVAAFGVVSKHGDISTTLYVNPLDLSDMNAIEKMVQYNVQTGYWSHKDGVQGILEHEFGHAIELHRSFVEQGVAPFSKDVNTKIDRSIAIKNYSKHKIADRELTEAFNNNNIKLTSDNLEKYISKYARKDFEKKGTLGEAWAEAVSNNKPNIITQYIQNIIRSW